MIIAVREQICAYHVVLPQLDTSADSAACDDSRENQADEESGFCMVHISFNDGNRIQSNFLGRVPFEDLLP